jgi:hypothetical protein
VAVARGNEKGRVERAIRYVRDSFFTARHFSGLDDLNAQAMYWCCHEAAQRPCPEDGAMSVGAALAAEQSHLLALPANPFLTDEQLPARAGKTPYVRFDLNDYSIPHTHVRRQLEVRASPEQVCVLADGAVIASPPPVALTLPEHVRRRDSVVRPHRLDSYDQLNTAEKDDEPEPT